MHNQSELPWLAPGCVRRDCEPHRGEVLCFAGTISAFCGLASVYLFLPSLVALPAGIIVCVMARKDLALMEAGLMDPRGKSLCETARNRSGLAIFSSSLILAFWGLLWLIPQILALLGYS
jgi:hypothetical protein